MKEVFIVRHAKSDWPEGVPDFERPLSKKGIKNAIDLGEEIYKMNIQPGIVYCSPAQRTKETLEKLSIKFKNQFQIIEDPLLYHGDVEDYLSLIHKTNDHYKRVMIIGHNPTVSALASRLDEGNKQYQLTTCNMVYFASEVNRWKDFDLAEEQWHYIP